METMNIKAVARWLVRESAGSRLRVAAAAVVGVMNVGCSLAFVWVTKHLVDIATGAAEGELQPFILLLIGVLVAQLTLGTILRSLDTTTYTRFCNRMRAKVFRHLMTSQWTGRETFHSADVLNRMSQDVATVGSLICGTIPSITITSVQLIGAFIFLLTLESRLALILVIIMPVALVASKLYMRRMRKLTAELRTTDSAIQTIIQENVQNRTLISSFEATGRSSDSLEDTQGRLMGFVMKRLRISLYSRGAVQFGFMAGYTVAFLWGVFGLQSGAVTFGMLTAFLQLVAQVQRPAVDLSQQLPVFIHASVSVERLQDLLATPSEESGEPCALCGEVGVRLTDVTFAYPDSDEPTLSDFSHDFRPGTLTVVAGHTGVGKSTLLRLMLALLRPQKGTIEFYNSKESVAVSPATRVNIAYVPQGNTLMSGTIRQNLLLANPEASEAEMLEALHTAAADFVSELPQGLDTPTGEGGAGLSEGQAQRIAIARGLLRKGGVLILDEPTSALDVATEQTLLERLKSQKRTIIMVTHRQAALTSWQLLQL